MVSGKTLAWIGIGLTVISGLEELIAFATSMLEGFKGFWDTLPPVIQLGLIIWLFWWIGNRK